jgi:hypothetical protein
MLLKLNKIAGFVLEALFLSFFIYMPLITLFPPKISLTPVFMSMVVVITAIFLFLFNYLFEKLILKIKQQNIIQSIRNWSKKKKIIAVALVMTAVTLVILIDPIITNFNNKRLLTETSRTFSVTNYGTISQNQVNRTLIELQKPLDILRGQYLTSKPDYLIKVYFFTDIKNLVDQTGMSDWAVGGTRAFLGKPPEILIPVEQKSSIWENNIPTSTPFHEITHVVTLEVMKFKDEHLIPLFFLEGMAEYESNKEFIRFPDRLNNRIGLLRHRNQLSTITSIMSLDIHDPKTKQDDINLFYSLSGEFNQYLAHKYGEPVTWKIIKDVGDGMTFYDSFLKEFKIDYFTAYSEFLKYFY